VSQAGLLDIESTHPQIPTTFDTDSGSAIPLANTLELLGQGGIKTSGSGNTVLVVGQQATETALGVVELATNAETTTGSDSIRAVVPSALKAKLGPQTANSIPYGDGDTNAIGWSSALTNGQLLIGANASNPIGGNITSLDGSITITNSPGKIDLSHPVGVVDPITKYVVDENGDTDYLTLQSGLDAANAAGFDAVVYARPGTYIENLTTYPGLTITGDALNTVIIGNHTPPATGTFTFSSVNLQAPSGDIFSSAAAGTAVLLITDCLIDVTDGYVFDLPNWLSAFAVIDCSDRSTDNGIANNSGGATLSVVGSSMGKGTGQTLTLSNGIAAISSSIIACPVSFAGTESVSINEGSSLLGTITTADNSSGSFIGVRLDTGTNAAIVHNSAGAFLYDFISINSSNTTCIQGTGAGVIKRGNISFLDNANTADTLTFTREKTLDQALEIMNGAFVESTRVVVAAAAGAITLSLDKASGGDLNGVFSSGYHFFDTTPALTVELTQGADDALVENFVYVPESTNTLTASTVNFPATEHIPIARVVCQSETTMQTKKAMKVQAWTDHFKSENQQGHISHLNNWVRKQNATWESGVAQNYTIGTNVGTPDNVTIQTSSGIVLQLHTHTFPAFANPIDYYVVNDFTTPYTIETDLNALLTDSTNASMAGKYFALVLWGCVSEDETDCKMFINLPSGSYNTAAGVTADADAFANFTIPAEFKGAGFLISQWNLKNSASSGGTWTSIDQVDLRGLFPGVSAGSGTAAATEFPDNTFRIFDDGDSTKEIAFQADQITTATTRTLTVQDADGIIALSGVANFGTGVQTLTDHGVLVGSGTDPITALSVGTTGQLLVGVSGADPVFGSSANADFTFTKALAGARTLTITHTDTTDSGSSAILDLVTGGANAGDPFVHLNNNVLEFSIGIDTSNSKLTITNGQDPSGGTDLITAKTTGEINIPGELNVGTDSASVIDTTAQITNEFTVGGGSVVIANRNLSADANSHAIIAAAVDADTSGDPFYSLSVRTGSNMSFGLRNSDADNFYLTSATSLAAAPLLKITHAGAITFNNVYTFPTADGNADQALVTDGAGAVSWSYQNLVQRVNATKTATQNTTTPIPLDDTIPQITEGDEVLTVSITPTNASNILVIEFNTFGTTSASIVGNVALFQDATANALRATTFGSGTTESWDNGVLFHYMAAGTTGSTTFRIRCGPNAVGNFYINGSSGGRMFGGVASTTLSVTEYKV
jgi:hypothetical protein